MNETTPRGLDDPRRLDSLHRAGVDARPDEAFDRFAELAALTISTPVAYVSLIDVDRQIFPGAVGLPRPWSDTRQAPLEHPLGHVTIAGEPVIIADIRTDPRIITAAGGIDVVAYAEMPLTDGDGRALGALCVIDQRPRDWTDRELLTLRTLAAACASELRLRIAASLAADADAQRGRWSAQVSRSLEASETTASADTIAEIATAVASLVPGESKPAFVALAVVDPADGLVHLIAPDAFADILGAKWRGGRLEDTPLRRCVTEGRQLAYASREAILAEFPHLGAEIDRLGWHALVCTPLRGDQGTIGALLFGWAEPHTTDLAEGAVLAAFTGYATQALQRVRRLNDRIVVAETLQRAMLTDLPDVDGLELAAVYHPAHAGDQVGGDWYDAFPLSDGGTALVIGDVAGHDITAATVMGQLRSMLRAYAIDRPGTPADLLARLDRATEVLDIATTATMVVADVSTDGHRPGQVVWSNAGHPPPLLIGPDGRATVLEGRSILIGARHDFGRATFSAALPAGSTIILYTDGLVETRGQHITDGIEKLRLLAEDLAGLALPDLLDALVTELGGPAPGDDIAVLGCRVPDRVGRELADGDQ